jgi:hypothetical protein
VSDEARLVRVSEVIDGAAFFALSLASERFGARPLVVKGTAEFRSRVAMFAGQKELAVTFADPKLEAQRVIAAFERSKGIDHTQDRGSALHRQSCVRRRPPTVDSSTATPRIIAACCSAPPPS